MQRSQNTPHEEAGEEAEQEDDREADESVAQTEAALTDAQEAQQQAMQAQQETLADEHHSLMQIRNGVQQQSGQPAQRLRHTACFRSAQLLLLHIHKLCMQWHGTDESILTYAAHA